MHYYFKICVIELPIYQLTCNTETCICFLKLHFFINPTYFIPVTLSRWFGQIIQCQIEVVIPLYLRICWQNI